MLNRGQGFRTALATATRGNGGQNEIGPEIFEALGVLRTEELAALHRFDGAEQYFTRAVDFGYSFSIDETFEKWGQDEITSDFVRLIRMIRPDVIFAMSPTGTDGGQHHDASAVISHDAYKLAGDAAKYPEQLEGGTAAVAAEEVLLLDRLRSSDARRRPAQADARRTRRCYDPLLGKTYSEIGTEARSMHKCQGMAQLLALPGPSTTELPADRVHDRGPAAARREVAVRRHRHVDRRARAVCRRAAAEGTDRRPRRRSRRRADRRRRSSTPTATMPPVPPLVTGLRTVRVLRSQLRAISRSTTAARFEIEFRLRQKEREFQQAAARGQRHPGRGAGRRRGRRARAAGHGIAHRREPRRADVADQAGQVRRVRRRRGVHADAGHRSPARRPGSWRTGAVARRPPAPAVLTSLKKRSGRPVRSDS